MRFNEQVLVQRTTGVTVNRVLRNTYILLSMTLLFCAVTAGAVSLYELAASRAHSDTSWILRLAVLNH